MTPEKLSAAVQLIKSGNPQAAIPILREIIQGNPQDENAWLWLYACVDQIEQKKYCLERVLVINPGHQGARKTLGKLINPPPPPTPPHPRPVLRPAPRRKPRRKKFSVLPILAGAFLLLMACSLTFIFLTQSGLVPSFAIAPIPEPTQPPTLTATATPEPSATVTPTATPSPLPTLTPTATVTATPSEVVEITWLCGLGEGTNTTTDREQAKALQSVVDDFNASQDFIHLNLKVVSYASGQEKFISDIATGEGPDIVGPMFLREATDLNNQWLDLTPYINPADLQAYHNPLLMEMYHADQGQMALPFVVEPSALFYNTRLFDAAGLKYPPAQYGEKYEMPDGSQVEWNWDALATVARLLTLDNKGLNATQQGFDKENIINYGYSWTFDAHPSTMGVYWGDGSMLAANGNTAHIPDSWRAAWQWTFDGVWGEQPFIPTKRVETGALLMGNSFNSGKIGMTVRSDWSVRFTPSLKTWDLAAIPSYLGQPGGKVDAFSFFVWKGSKHPHEAYQAVSYLVDQGFPDLTKIFVPYAPISARKDQRQAWLNAQQQAFPWVTNWDVLIAGLNYPEKPNMGSYLHNADSAWKLGYSFYDRVFGEPGLDLAAEELNYLNDLNKLFAGEE